jgi:hypothetical protein
MSKKKIDIELKKELAIQTLKWCKRNFGLNKRKKLPKISVRIRFIDEDSYPFGEYYWEDNRIIIYDSKCKSMTDVISTVIHEYTHYLQSMKKYYEYFNTHYYSTHPFEREAIRNSKLYTKKCLNSIKKLIY